MAGTLVLVMISGQTATEIICYVTRKKFAVGPAPADSGESNSSNTDKPELDVFGFGISLNKLQANYLSSPCEFLTAEGFESLCQHVHGRRESVRREEIHYFLPLYINQTHASQV